MTQMRRVELPVAAELRVHARSGAVTVIAEPRDDVAVEGDGAEARERDGAVEVRAGHGGSRALTVRCPVGGDVTVGTQSGPVRLVGDFGSTSVTTANGAIEIERAEEADLRTVSGDISLGQCDIRCRLNSVSGQIVAGRVESISAGSMSGAIRIEHVGGKLKARSVSGSIECACDGDGDIVVKTVSGKVVIELPRGTTVSPRFKTLSGRVRCPFAEGDDVRIEAMTVSGSIELVPA